MLPGAIAATTVLLKAGVVAALATALSPCWAQDYRPVTCSMRMIYQGQAAYAGEVLLPAIAASSAEAFDASTSQRLESAMGNAMRLARAEAMTAAVESAKGRWSATKTADGADSGLKLYWASVGKAVTASIVLQLVEERKLALDSPVSNWFAEFPNSAVITIDDLLRHTAGVFSANEDKVVMRERRYQSPEESIAVARRHGAMFCPGQHWRYSNTGYAMLGRVIEAIEGKPYHQVVAERIAKPLGLQSFHAMLPGEGTAADVAALAPADKNSPYMEPGWGYAAGNIVSSAADMLAFWWALLGARLLAPATTALLFKPLLPMFDAGTFYGRGVMLYTLPNVPGAAPQTWLGHSGGASGVKAVVVYSPQQEAFVAVAITGDGSAEATANLLLRQLLEKP